MTIVILSFASAVCGLVAVAAMIQQRIAGGQEILGVTGEVDRALKRH
jgi:hypothetical protein